MRNQATGAAALLLALPLILGTAARAQDPISPERGLVGTFRLDRVDDRPLPVQTGTFAGCHEHILSGAVQLFDDGTYVMKTLSRQTCAPDGSESVSYNEFQWGAWGRDGDTALLDETAFGAVPENPDRRDYWVGLPLEDMGDTARLEDKRLVVHLKDGDTLASFLPTDDRGDR